MSEQTVCGCDNPAHDLGDAPVEEDQSSGSDLRIRLLALVLSVNVWFPLYRHTRPFSEWLTYSVFGLTEGTHLGEAIEFFVYDTPKVLLLLSLVVFAVGVIRSFVTPNTPGRFCQVAGSSVETSSPH